VFYVASRGHHADIGGLAPGENIGILSNETHSDCPSSL